MISGFENKHQMYRMNREMVVQTVLNGIILPRKMTDSGPMWGMGGVCDEKNEFVDLSYYDGGWATQGGSYQWEEEEYCEYDVVYFGLYFAHWGHFLIDLMGRLWYYASGYTADKNVKLAYIGEEEPKGNFLEIFQLLGISQEDMIHITTPTRFRSVIVPEFSCRSCDWYSEEYKSIFDSMIHRVELENYESEELRNLEKVHFSRLSFGKAKASEFGEKNIVKWLEANDFVSVSPEKLSVRDQIYLWNHCREIACLDGSIPMGVVFSNNTDLKLTIMHKTSLEHLNVELYLLMRPCDVTLLDVWHEPFRGYPKNIGAGPFLLHLGEDARVYSDRRGWVFPFTADELEKERKINCMKLAWRIGNLDMKLRIFVSRVVPRSVKDAVRRILHG